jgi:hypothetical protein
MSPELISKLAIWRAKANDNRLTQEDMKEAIQALRGDRVGSAIASARSNTKKAAAKVAPPSAADLLGEMDDE